MELLLIRHAQTHSNVARALDTAHPGADLTDLGDRQAADLVAALAAEPIDAVWCSPRLRARRTAHGLAASRGLDLIERDGVVEIAAGATEMSTDEAHALAYRDVVAGWIGGDLDVRMPGGEDGHETLARFDAVVAEIEAAGHQRVALVSHGAVIRFWCGVRVPSIGLDLRRAALRNTGLVRLERAGSRWRALEWDAEIVEPAPDSGPLSGPV